MSLPELEVQHIKCLPCEYCGKPVNPAELPVVLEWGKKDASTPAHIGRPWKRVAHLDCDRQARGIKVKERKPSGEATEKPLKVGHAVARVPSAPRSQRSNFAGLKVYRKAKTNPRKPGTHGFNSFNLIKDGMSYEAYIAAGGRVNDLKWDVEHGWVEVK